jgi:hypothetical protein
MFVRGPPVGGWTATAADVAAAAAQASAAAASHNADASSSKVAKVPSAARPAADGVSSSTADSRVHATAQAAMMDQSA